MGLPEPVLLWFRYGDPTGRCARIRTWAALADWQRPLSASALGDTVLLASLARRLTADCTDEECRFRRIGDAVRDKVTYRQVYLADAGWRPRPAVEVWRSGFGDCKDMSHLAVGLLNSLGINAHPVLIDTRGLSLAQRQLPGLWFNHCIVAVPQASLSSGFEFFDPTVKDRPPGTLPWYLHDADALVLGDPSDSALVRTLADLPEEHGHSYRVVIEVQPDRSAVCTARHEWRGEAARRLWGAIKDEAGERQVEILAARLLQGCPGTEIAHGVSLAITAGHDTLTATWTVRVPGFVTSVAGTGILRVDPVEFLPTGQFAADPSREVRLPPPYVREGDIVLRLPRDGPPSSIPADCQIDNPGLSYSRSIRPADGVLRIHRRVTFHQPRFEESDFPVVLAWMKAVASADDDRMTVVMGHRR